MRKIIAAAALSATVALGGCANPNGSVNWGNTLLLGAGVAGAAGLVALASQNNHGYGPNRGYGGSPQYSSGYGRGYRGW